jgi:hypothetical protein
LWVGLLVVGALLFAPAAWASEEDVREQGAPAKSDKKDDDAKGQAGSAGKPEAEAEGSTAAPQEPSDGETEPSGADPGLNTLEDILAYRGPLETLWTPRSEPAPEVTWRDADARPAEPR